MAIFPQSEPPLRIVHALFTQRIAGSERYCIDLAQRQAALGHEVHVVGTPRSQIREALGAGVRFHPLATPLWRAARLARLLARLDAQVYHAHLSAACKAAAAAPAGVATVATLHVGYKPHQQGHVGGLICVNRSQLASLGEHRGLARCIPNWMPASCADDAAGAPDLRQALGLAPQQFVVAAAGRLHRSKGMDLLIQAFRSAAPADAVLLLMGEGKEERRLRRLAAGDARIHLLGYRSDVRALFAQADLFVSPSREETFGLALLEAMQAGLPVLATAAAGPLEVLADQPAQLVPTEDPHALGTALGEAIKRLQHAGRPRSRYALDAFEPGRAVAAVLDFYADVRAAQTLPRPQERPVSGAQVAHA